MKEKLFYKLIVLFVILGLAIVGTINYLVDPFFVYHKPYFGLEPYVYGEMYQNLGMAKHFEYDTLVTGTSMTEGFVASWFDEKYDCNALKLPFAGGNMKDFTNLFDVSINNNNDIKRIFYGLDIYSLLVDPDSTRFEYEDYQLTNNPLSHLSYLLNNQILMKYGLQMVTRTQAGQKFDKDSMYVWESESQYGKEIVLNSYQRPDILEKRDENSVNQQELNYYQNIDNLIYYIENYPNIEFYIFYPSYSILYWDFMTRIDEIDFELGILKSTTERLLSYDNVKLYGFIMNEDIITNLDNYKDYTHYKQDINRYMLESFDTSNDEINIGNYQQKFEDFEDLIYNYNYDEIFK